MKFLLFLNIQVSWRSLGVRSKANNQETFVGIVEE